MIGGLELDGTYWLHGIWTAEKTLNRLFEKELGTIEDDDIIVRFCICSLYDRFKYNIVKIFSHLSNDDIYKISLFFLENKNLKTGLEIFNHLRYEKTETNDEIINELKTSELNIEHPLIVEILEKCTSLNNSNGSEALSSIATLLAESKRFDEAFQVAHAIEDDDDRLKSLFLIAQLLARSNELSGSIEVANTIEDACKRSLLLYNF